MYLDSLYWYRILTDKSKFNLNVPFQTFEYLLQSAGKLTPYQNARKPQKSGKKISNFIVDQLEQKYKKQGTNSSVYTKERKYFEDTITKAFYDIMVG